MGVLDLDEFKRMENLDLIALLMVSDDCCVSKLSVSPVAGIIPCFPENKT